MITFNSPTDAIVGLMYSMLCIDKKQQEFEFVEIENILKNVRIFEQFDDGYILAISDDVLNHFNGEFENHALRRDVAKQAAAVLRPRLRELAFQLVNNIAMADLERAPEEEDFLDVISSAFELNPVVDHALRYASVVRRSGLEAKDDPDVLLRRVRRNG